MLGLLDSYVQRYHLADFLRWWWGELSAMLPARLRQKAMGTEERLVFNVEGDEMVAYCHGADTSELLGRFPLAFPHAEQKDILARQIATRGSSGKYAILRLPRQIALQKVVDLPLAAEENLRQVLAFEMDRQTPFKAEQVYFDYEVLARQPDAKRLKVRLTAVPRRVVDEMMQKLSSWGIQPECVDIAGIGAAGPCRINLLPVERRVQRQRARHWLKWAAAAAITAMLILAVVLPLWQDRQAVVALEPRVISARKEAEQVTALREQLNKLTAESHYLVDKKAQSAVVLEVMNELTRLLPDDTWLSSVELSGRQLRIQGESSAASALIGLIESSPLFSQTSFSSPVTQNPTTNRERFQLSATVELLASTPSQAAIP
jgi:general secretion pathway protein L